MPCHGTGLALSVRNQGNGLGVQKSPRGEGAGGVVAEGHWHQGRLVPAPLATGRSRAGLARLRMFEPRHPFYAIKSKYPAREHWAVGVVAFSSKTAGYNCTEPLGILGGTLVLPPLG